MPRKDRAAASTTAHLLRQSKTKQWDWASEAQEAFFKYGPFPVMASGGFGSGKTIGACRKVLWFMSEFPNSRIVIVRKTWEHLSATTMRTFFKVCPPAAYIPYGRRSDQGKELVLNNGSSITWMHLNHPESLNVLRGLEINAFFLDQAEEIDEEVFDVLLGRLGRWDHAEVPEYRLRRYRAQYGRTWPWRHPVSDEPVPPSYAIGTCNPEHELHWIYRRFHPESTEYEKPRISEAGVELPSYKSRGYRMFTMSSDTNRYLDRVNLSNLLNHDTAYVNKYVYGIWGNPAGAVHLVPRDVEVEATPELVDWILRNCRLHLTLDHGDSAPTCVIWWGEDRDGNLWAYREYYRTNNLISAHRQAVYELSEPERRMGLSYQTRLADPSIFAPIAQKGGRRWSVSAEWADRLELPRPTAIDWTAANNEELTTRNRINEFLKMDELRVHPVTRTSPAPRLYILSATKTYPFGCTRLLSELRSQRREKIGTVDGRDIFSDDRDDTVPDHAYDCLRYRISVPGMAAPPQYAENKPGTFLHTWANLQRRQVGEGVLKSLPRIPEPLEEPPKKARRQLY